MVSADFFRSDSALYDLSLVPTVMQRKTTFQTMRTWWRLLRFASHRVVDAPVVMQQQMRVFPQVQHIDKIFCPCLS